MIKGQEEMVGFSLIVMIVMIILIIFLGISLSSNNEKETVESFEVSSFNQAMLEYTTSCIENYEPNYLNVRELIFSCEGKKECLDGKNSCEILESTISDLIKESWFIGEGSSLNGYEINISSENEEILYLFEG